MVLYSGQKEKPVWVFCSPFFSLVCRARAIACKDRLIESQGLEPIISVFVIDLLY